ncbi:DNA-binding protein [Halobacteriales archaeon QH_10_67_13]|nr:MAG: DNA-binding protein [Halobacteriales archaeon QH_10_67_13]
MSGTETPTVLVVEDEADLVEMYELWLAGEYDIRTALDGQTGLEALDAEVDVVILDRRMPGLSGDEVLKHIDAEGFDCRVAMVTAVEPDFDILEMGFDAYLPKPVGQEQLRTTVERLLERAAYDNRLQEYYALVEKQATLEATKRRVELANSEEYDRLTERIDHLQTEFGRIDSDEEFIATIQQIESHDRG